MNNRKIIKGYKTLISSRFNVDTSVDKSKDGIIYTLYSDAFNSLKVGFAENDKVLEKKLSSEALILLDMKKGKKKDLCLLITTLNELGIKSKKPIGNGIITSLNMRQAKKRSFIKGQEAANAVIEVMKND